MISFLMLGSLILGLIAWILPFINLVQFKKNNNRNWAVKSILSISTCAISLYLQIFYNNYLVKIGDLSALMDTTNASTFVSAVLLIVTVIINSMNLIIFSQSNDNMS